MAKREFKPGQLYKTKANVLRFITFPDPFSIFFLSLETMLCSKLEEVLSEANLQSYGIAEQETTMKEVLSFVKSSRYSGHPMVDHTLFQELETFLQVFERDSVDFETYFAVQTLDLGESEFFFINKVIPSRKYSGDRNKLLEASQTDIFSFILLVFLDFASRFPGVASDSFRKLSTEEQCHVIECFSEEKIIKFFNKELSFSLVHMMTKECFGWTCCYNSGFQYISLQKRKGKSNVKTR